MSSISHRTGQSPPNGSSCPSSCAAAWSVPRARRCSSLIRSPFLVGQLGNPNYVCIVNLMQVAARGSLPSGGMSPGPSHPTPTASPLVRLWRYSGGHRRTVIAAMVFSVLNKLADVMPELLIGAAVDVVVRANDSIVATVFGVEDRFDQLLVLAAINVGVWIVESATDYVAQLLWRNLAQTIEHEARMDAYRHVQRLELAWFEDQSTGGALSILHDDVHQPQ